MQPITVRFWLPVFHGHTSLNLELNTADVGISNVAGTVRVYADTTELYITQHGYSSAVEIPFQPHSFEQFTHSSGKKWHALETDDYSVTQTSRMFGVYQVPYWRIVWTGRQRAATDVRILKL